MWYSHRGKEPALLPNEIQLRTGKYRTNPASFTPSELLGAGYTLAKPKPDVDPSVATVTWENQEWVVTPVSLEDQRATKYVEFDQRFEQEVTAFRGSITMTEVVSWTVQDLEARGSGSKLLAKMAQERGITLAQMKARVVAQSDIWNDFYGPLLGKKQRLGDLVEAASTSEEIQLVTWDE